MTIEKSNMPSDRITWAPKLRTISPAFHAPPLFLETNIRSDPITWAPKLRTTSSAFHAPPLFLEKS